MTTPIEITPVRVGAATVTILNAGDMLERMTLVVPPEEREMAKEAGFDRRAVYPFLCAHIGVPGASIMVDTCDYPASMAILEAAAPPDYVPPPSIPEQLRALDIPPEDVTHLVITHNHHDHHNGTTQRAGSHVRLAYPNAQCYAGHEDWDGEAGQELLEGDAAWSIGEWWQQGRLNLVSGNDASFERGGFDLAPGVRLFAAPGETPGHLIVRVQSEGQTLYVLGDLVHHPIEFTHPGWMVSWAESTVMLTSREALIRAALVENALLIASHIPAVGRLRRLPDGSGVQWVALTA